MPIWNGHFGAKGIYVSSVLRFRVRLAAKACTQYELGWVEGKFENYEKGTFSVSLPYMIVFAGLGNLMPDVELSDDI